MNSEDAKKEDTVVVWVRRKSGLHLGLEMEKRKGRDFFDVEMTRLVKAGIWGEGKERVGMASKFLV